MGLKVSDSGGGNFTPAPAGTHAAICVQVIDLGTQYSEYYKKSNPKVLLGFELPDERNDEDEPFLVWTRYTASLGEKAKLRQHLAAWRGRDFTPDELEGFELKNVLGKPCMLSITHRADGNKTYADVQSVMKLPKNMPPPEQTHDLILFDLDEPDWAVFETFGDNLKATIKRSEEMTSRNGHGGKTEPVAAPDNDDNGGPHESLDEDSIPFN